MTGAILNAAGIATGGLISLTFVAQLKPSTQSFFKLALGVFTVFFGLRLTWLSVNGPFLQILKQLAVAMLALMVGKAAGSLMHFQKSSNRLGQFVRSAMERAKPGVPQRFSDGFNTCAVLYCAAPLGILGAVQDGLTNYYYPLIVKAVMDGLATLSFVRMFGWGAMLSAVPVLIFLGSVTLACNQYLEPFLRLHGLTDSINAVGGLLVCTVGLVIFELRKVELADFLPSLVIAPLITSFLQ